MEKDLILVGATAVEDKLQKGVPQCIDKLAQAGLKIWVLTGDKMETAINIGFACSLLRQGMKQICITLTNSDTSGRGSEKEKVLMQVTDAAQMVRLEKDPHAAFALIIDGKTLAYALEDDVKHQFLGLAVECASVICCRVSPKQKALVTRLVKEATGKTTLAIGDGANDVGMIQEADIGVGISGVENSPDDMLLLLQEHSIWIDVLLFRGLHAFSGQSIYDDWYMILFNVFITSLPVISLGVFEQDVSLRSACSSLRFTSRTEEPVLRWWRIYGWMANGLIASIIVFTFNIAFFYDQPFRSGGQTADMTTVGTAMFTCIVWVVNCQIALTMSHFTWIQHFVIWGSIGFWYVFLLIYGMLPPQLTGNVYQILEVLALPRASGQSRCSHRRLHHVLLCTLSAQRCFNPMDHHVIQEIKYLSGRVG
ncbi:hypothetical protein MLD38_029478 [Melastoma candidum]|uniref:Uncharacterized protein n=1 Tax=Melastoma candidum TaxID=119954 RepID=A0ACB9N6G1_9MYRT|nr:hypothetical protein MLD38_029478 [Melastoma candidum]